MRALQGVVKYACSEEVPEPVDMQGEGFSVAFDPLDGSSIVDTNFTVGTIFGIWPGNKLTGITGRDQVLTPTTGALFFIFCFRRARYCAISSAFASPYLSYFEKLWGLLSLSLHGLCLDSAPAHRTCPRPVQCVKK